MISANDGWIDGIGNKRSQLDHSNFAITSAMSSAVALEDLYLWVSVWVSSNRAKKTKLFGLLYYFDNI